MHFTLDQTEVLFLGHPVYGFYTSPTGKGFSRYTLEQNNQENSMDSVGVTVLLLLFLAIRSTKETTFDWFKALAKLANSSRQTLLFVSES